MSSEEAAWNDALYAAAREVGSLESPAQLAKRGVRRVRCVPREKITALLDKALENALRRVTPANGEVSGLVDDMQAGWLGLVRGAQKLETVRAAMADHRKALTGELDALEGARGAESEGAIRDRDMAIDRLERRVAKLIASLDEVERALQRVLATREIDAGIASLYRVVQGLAMHDPRIEQKKAMMEEIFLANMELRASMQSSR